MLKDGGEVVSLKHWSSFIFRKIPSTHFCQMLSKPSGELKDTSMTLTGIEPATFRLAAQRHNQPSYGMLHLKHTQKTISVALSPQANYTD
jgi:hypothetical protein